jgi:hypothetical protein
MNRRLAGRRIVCFYPWTPFEPGGAWSRFECLWKFLVEQGASVTLAFLAHTPEGRLRNIAVRCAPSFNALGAIWQYGQKLAGAGARPELRALSQAELSLLLMFEKELYLENDDTRRFFEQVVLRAGRRGTRSGDV